MLANAAFVTGAVSLFIWAATQMVIVLQKRVEKSEKERIALVQFYTDVWLRARYLRDVMTASAVEHFERVIDDHEQQKRPLRFYGAQISDQRSFERMNETLHLLDSRNAELVSKYMQLDRLFVIQYDKLQSEAFEKLSSHRQVAALRDCAASTRELQALAERLTAQMPEWIELKKWRGKRRVPVSDQRSDRSHDSLLKDGGGGLLFPDKM